MLPKADPKYVLILEESMMYVDAQGMSSKREDHRYTRAHQLVRDTLCRSPHLNHIVSGYEPKGRRALVYFLQTLDKKVMEELRARTKGIVAKVEVKKS